MMKLKNGFWVLSVMLLVGCTSVVKTFDQAQVLATSQEPELRAWALAEIRAVSDSILPAKACETFLQIKHDQSHTFVLEINNFGQVAEVFHDKQTELGACFTAAWLKKQFSPPPIAPAFVSINIDLEVPDRLFLDEPVAKDIVD